jgi:hypothetical protein
MNTHSNTTVEDSITLGGLPSVIGDESEYVFVDDVDDDEFEDDEYDHMTDLSPVISCDGSVATELTDLKSLIDEGVAMINNSDNASTTAMFKGTKTGRRVSNKKRRKMLKMMKKAAAAAAAKEALEANRFRDLSSSTSSEEYQGVGLRRARRRERSNSGGSSYKERKARASNNFQVACAQQALAAHRKVSDEASNVW